jgi:hypothetical protein
MLLGLGDIMLQSTLRLKVGEEKFDKYVLVPEFADIDTW